MRDEGIYMKRILVVAVTARLAAPALAGEQIAFEVLRSGDSEMSCAGLSTEIDALSANVLKLNQQAEKRAKASRTTAAVGKGVFSGLARGVSIIGYGSTSPEAFASLLASNVAAGVAQHVASDATAPSPAVVASPATSPQQQRLDTLNAIYRERPC